MKLPAAFPPLWFLANLGLALWVRHQVPTPLALPEAHRILGQTLVWMGAIWALNAMVAFRRHRTTVIPFRRPDRLIRTGPFRWSRNPIYLGEAVILAGACLKFGHALPWLSLPLFVAGTTRFVIKREEITLRAQFGDLYTAYCRQTRRWL
jgi:protein-S-isoprenylcysteine O-methyltransferase Ste14